MKAVHLPPDYTQTRCPDSEEESVISTCPCVRVMPASPSRDPYPEVEEHAPSTGLSLPLQRFLGHLEFRSGRLKAEVA